MDFHCCNYFNSNFIFRKTKTKSKEVKKIVKPFDKALEDLKFRKMTLNEQSI